MGYAYIDNLFFRPERSDPTEQLEVEKYNRELVETVNKFIEKEDRLYINKYSNIGQYINEINGEKFTLSGSVPPGHILNPPHYIIMKNGLYEYSKPVFKLIYENGQISHEIVESNNETKKVYLFRHKKMLEEIVDVEDCQVLIGVHSSIESYAKKMSKWTKEQYKGDFE